MKVPPSILLVKAITRSVRLLPLAAFLLAACGPGETKSRGGLSAVVEVRADGLAYEKGAATPYTGEVKEFSATGRLAASTAWRQGRRHGMGCTWWPNGKPRSEELFADGEVILHREWFENGILKKESPMKDGGSLGLVQIWWPDGRLRRRVYLEPNLAIHGNLLEYNKDGSVLWDAIFEHGRYVSGTGPPEKLAEILAQQRSLER